MSKELLANNTVSHYRILAKLGAGGMGEVYLAQDTKLDRKVALKILPPEFAEDAERMRRFVQEAKAASALNHPNILTIHEIGETDGQHYIATEFIEGETLRHHIQHSRMKLREVLDAIVQVASALAAAHQAGIIHRDIKPDNIMVRPDGYVKVLDFGLAKLSEKPTPATDSEAATILLKATDPGTVMGTVGYMSPEQARGKETDARTDIFSLGCVLYEMLARRQPFTGETINHTIVAILEKDPPPVSQLVRDCPAEIERIVNKALAKELGARYQSTKELSADLEDARQELEFQSRLERTSSPDRKLEAPTQIISAATTAEEKHSTGQTRSGNSIAVLPFTNMSADAENEYFCDGLAEELLNALAKIEDLRVAARTSAFSFKGKNTNISEIGRQLNVYTVLEGSVRKSGNRVRISVQLVNASDGFHLWSERYDREMKGIFDVQDEITLAVVDALKLKLLGEEKSAVLKRHTSNSEAYEFYLRGLSYFNRWTPDDFQKAIESFRQAIAIDPGYASAYASLSEAYTEMAFFSFSSPSDWIPKAREATSNALDLDDTLGAAHTSLAIIKMYHDWDFAGAEREFGRALALDPGSAPIHMWYGWYLGLMGRFDEGLKELQDAWELDPLSDPINLGIGVIFHWSRQPERAIERFRRVLELSPNYYVVYPFLAGAYEQTGDFVSAIAEIENVRKEVNDPMTLSALGHVYAKAGNRHKALEILKELEKRSSQEYVTAFNIAQIYVGLGDNEQAFAWLDKAYAERSLWLSWLRVDPKFDPLRPDPRFQDLLRRIGFPE